MDKKVTYTIQQVAEMTGLSKQVIRKWEDRYGIIEPKRLENGYRIYTQNDVEILQKIIDLTKAGYSVKQAAILVQQQNEEKEQERSNPQSEMLLRSLVEAGRNANEKEILRLLEQAHYLFDLQTLLDGIIVPFLRTIGDLWCDKEWGEYQEAISSQTVRDFLTNLRRHFKVDDTAPLVLGSCLPNERHEIPIHLLLVQAMLHGYRTLMLGPSPAPNAIESAVLQTKPEIVLLSGSTDAIWEDNGSALKELDSFAGTTPQTSYFIGGAAIKAKLPSLQHIKEAHSIREVLK